jgi:sulfite reductase (NADPH) flavoprotein alpha-component
MPLPERMQLAQSKPLPRRLFAAMAQQDCGQCGYLCETYSAAIASGQEAKLNLCVPGGKETSRMLKRLLEETPPAAVKAPTQATGQKLPSPAPRYSRRSRLSLATPQRRDRKDTRHQFEIASGLCYTRVMLRPYPGMIRPPRLSSAHCGCPPSSTSPASRSAMR